MARCWVNCVNLWWALRHGESVTGQWATCSSDFIPYDAIRLADALSY